MNPEVVNWALLAYPAAALVVSLWLAMILALRGESMDDTLMLGVVGGIFWIVAIPMILSRRLWD